MEIWKDIEGYEGLYQVSNMGRVKSIDRVVLSIRLKKDNFKSKILKPSLSGKYYVIGLCKLGKAKNQLIHRLVAKSFIPNPENKPEVNHIKGIKTDNRASELEWSTSKENSIHSKEVLGNNPTAFDNKRSKEVVQISLDGFLIEIFGSINDASRKTGVPAAHISETILGKRKRSGGYLWR